MPGDAEGVRVRIRVIFQTLNFLSVPLCYSLTVVTERVEKRRKHHCFLSFSDHFRFPFTHHIVLFAVLLQPKELEHMHILMQAELFP